MSFAQLRTKTSPHYLAVALILVALAAFAFTTAATDAAVVDLNEGATQTYVDDGASALRFDDEDLDVNDP